MKNKSNQYQLKIVSREGSTHVSVVGSGLGYSHNGKHEPKGIISKPFKDTRNKRKQTLRKLGIWENGQNSRQVIKQR